MSPPLSGRRDEAERHERPEPSLSWVTRAGLASSRALAIAALAVAVCGLVLGDTGLRMFVAGPVSVILALPALALAVRAHRRLADERTRSLLALAIGASVAAAVAVAPLVVWVVAVSTVGAV